MSLLSLVLAFVGFTPAPALPPLPPPSGTTPPVRRRKWRGNPTVVPVLETVAPETETVAPAPEIRRNELAYTVTLTSAAAVRVLLLAARQGASDVGLGGFNKNPPDARRALGRDLAAYVDLCIEYAQALPSQEVALELRDEAKFRARLKREMLAALPLWERARRIRDRERDDALDAGVTPPEPLFVPPSVEAAIAARDAERAAAREAERKGGRASGSTPPPPPAGPRRSRR